MTRAILVFLLSLLSYLPVAAQPTVGISSIDGVTNGTIVQLTSEYLEVDNPHQQIPLQDLVCMGGIRERANRSWVILKHGEVIVADQLTLHSDSIHLESLFWQPLDVDWQEVSAVIRNVPKVLSARDRLLKTLFTPAASPFVIFNQGTRINGNVSFLADGQIRIESPTINKELVVPFTELSAYVNQSIVAEDPATSFVGFADGSFGGAAKVSRDGSSLHWTTSTGIVLRTAEPFFNLEDFNVWEQLIHFRPGHSHFVYLDDLEPSSTRILPFFDGNLGHDVTGQRVTPGLGLNSQKGRLRQGANLYLHGIGMTSLSRVSFVVPTKATRFQAEIAVDTIAGKRGSVTFHVYLRRESGDWESVYASGVVRGRDTPQAIDVDLESAQQLALVVGMADRAKVADYANWLNARFVIRTDD